MAKLTDEKQNDLDWLELQKKLTTNQYAEESGLDKFIRKFGENPLIPTGIVATSAALGMGLYAMKIGDRKLSQYMMRARVGAQAFTIVAITSGLIYTAYKD